MIGFKKPGFFPTEFFDPLKRLQLFSPGALLFLLIILSPVIVWALHFPESAQNPFIAVAKFNAFMALSVLSVNFVLATKMRFLEKIFGGLDLMYRVHKATGRLSLIFMVVHPVMLLVAKKQFIVEYVIPTGPLDVALGVLSLYIFLLLLAFTVALKMPYHWWHNSHKVLGIVLLLAGLHAFLAGSDLGKYPILRAWLMFLVTWGVVSWLYMLLLFKFVSKHYKVKISKVKHFGDITEISFKKPKGLEYLPGQYLFMRFPRFEGYKELFPFSISSDPAQKQVRISIKKSGDYTTNKVPLLKKGDRAIVMGPYGMFGKRYLRHDRDMVWIAGGIGITPFLSLAKHETINPTGRKILLIWAVKNEKEAFHDHELEAESNKNENFSYILWSSEDKGRISANEIRKIVGDDLNERVIFLCGPPPMMYSVSKGLHRMGIPYMHTVFEDFNMLD